jgi:predicted nucleic acid-binding protein
LIPLLCEWHEFHARTAASIAKVPLKSMVICCHVLLECFVVLTRLPAPYRIPPRQAERLLAANFSNSVHIPGVLERDTWASLARVAEQQTGGGKVYDAVVAHATAQAGASTLLTWNVKDFLVVAPHGLEIRTP